MNDYIFNDKSRCININKADLPSPWINYLSNGHMYAFVSQAGGGMTWVENPVQYRLSRYRMYNMPIDSPGFYVYIKHNDGTVWSPSFRPAETKLNSFTAKHYPGKTVFEASKNDIKARLTLFIMPDMDVLTWKLEIDNENKATEVLDIFAYIELSQHKWVDEIQNGYYWKHMLKTWFDKDSQSVQYLYHHFAPENKEKVPLVYFASNAEVLDYSGDRDAFTGNYRYERNPIAVEKGHCGNEEIQSGEPCAALHIKLNCTPQRTERADFYLGAVSGGMLHIADAEHTVKEQLKKIRNMDFADEQEEKLDMWWAEHLSRFECQIPDTDAQRQINIWGPINSVTTARFSRSINASAPGVRTLGYRDTCQDMLAITYRNADVAKERLYLLMSRQHKNGNAIHSFEFLKTEKPGCSLHCDNHLWLPFLAYSLMCETGDKTVLDKEIGFLDDDYESEYRKGTAWEHLMAAMEFTQNHLGIHSMPLTYRGDWNDIIGKFSKKDKGESVFAAQQYVTALKLMIKLAEYIGKDEDEKKLSEYCKKQLKNIDKFAWNGKWWFRCFDDEGNAIGSEKDEFGKIWLNSQTWSVISGSGTEEQRRTAMQEVSSRLDTGIGLAKLTPGFETWPKIITPFSGYNPGTGENGSVFCHAHTWAVIAEAMLGNAERAWKYYNDILPHKVIQKIGIERYKSEPYSWCSNIVSYPNNKHGWGNISHISGTAVWMNLAATQYLLGIRPVLKGMLLDPCVPADWEKFSVKRMFRDCMLEIEFKNPDHKNRGISYMEVDGQKINGNFIDEKNFSGRKNICIKAVM